MAVLPFYEGHASVWDGNLLSPMSFRWGPGISGDWCVGGGIRPQVALVGPARNPSADSREETPLFSPIGADKFLRLSTCGSRCPYGSATLSGLAAVLQAGSFLLSLLLWLSDQGFGGLSSSFRAGPHTEQSLPSAPPLSEEREG